MTHSTALWLRAFALTVAIEEAIAVPLLAPLEPSRVRRAMAVLVVNLATHPLVWFFFPHLGWKYAQVLVGAEAWAFGFEIVGYRVIFAKSSWRRCAIASVAANMGSFLVGLVLTELGWLR